MKQLIKVNNKWLEIYRKGEEGQPVLILTGMGCSFEEWLEVMEKLSETHRVTAFHRPGLGKSEIGKEERSTQETAEDIASLKEVLDISEPLVVIGHSYGGLCAQHFAKLYPNRIDALVLVDSTSVDLERLDDLDLPVMNVASSDEKWLEECALYAQMDVEELKKQVEPGLSQSQEQLPPAVQRNLIGFQQSPNLYRAMLSEAGNWKRDAKMIKSLGTFPDIPLAVIGRDKNHAVRQGIDEGFPESEVALFESVWEQLITEQAALSSKSTLVFAENEGHSIHLDRPDIIIEAVTGRKAT